MTGMSVEEGINQVYGGGGHVVILGAGASIASTLRSPEVNGKILPSMNTFIDVVGLQELIENVPEHLFSTNFEELYTNLHSADPDSEIVKEIQKRVRDYFSDMKLPNEPTIYDYLILSLRNKDLIATFNWDPFLYQAWCRNREFTKNLPFMAYLHGTVSLGYSVEDDISGPAGYYCRQDGGYLEPTQLLYPVSKKDYNADKFISQEWARVKYWLSKKSGAVRATIFGYGAPVSDVEAVELLNQAWGTPDDRPMEQFEIIDSAPEKEVLERWKGFIHSHHYDFCSDYFKSSLAHNPRRTSESYFSHIHPFTPHEAFRRNNPVPDNLKTMEELWEWHQPLIEAEKNKEISNE